MRKLYDFVHSNKFDSVKDNEDLTTLLIACLEKDSAKFTKQQINLILNRANDNYLFDKANGITHGTTIVTYVSSIVDFLHQMEN